MQNKILFLKLGDFSLINDSIFKILQNEFGEDAIDVLDVKEIWKRNFKFYHYLINLWYFTKEYGKDFILGYKKLNDWFSWFFGTSYMSRLTDKYIRETVKGRDYKFSFQTQCLF